MTNDQPTNDWRIMTSGLIVVAIYKKCSGTDFGVWMEIANTKSVQL